MTSPSISLDPDWTDIRDGVRAVCAAFGNDYWVKLEHDSAYPTAFSAPPCAAASPGRAPRYPRSAISTRYARSLPVPRR